MPLRQKIRNLIIYYYCYGYLKLAPQKKSAWVARVITFFFYITDWSEILTAYSKHLLFSPELELIF